MRGFLDILERAVFRHRLFAIISFALITCFLLFKATQIQLDASFNKNIPLNHDYMKVYTKHEKQFGGANSILISVCDADGDIFNEEFFTQLKAVHDQLYFIPGVNRPLVNSIFAPSARFVEVVEDGFAGGPIIPANFTADKRGLAVVKENIEKAKVVGRMIASDYSCAMVTAQLLETDPQTQEKLDTLAFAEKLETQVRDPLSTDKVSIHIIGFAKMAGDVAEGAKGVLLFFAIAIAFTFVMVWLFCQSLKLTILPIACSIIAVVWQLGLLSTLGFGLDPMSILVPFLVFAIGVSHGVQMINDIGKKVSTGSSTRVCCQASFRALLIPGGIALLSDTIGFLTLLTIDIGIIRELAITASLGVAVIIFTNLILLPVWASYMRFEGTVHIQAGTHTDKPNFLDKLRELLVKATDRKTAGFIIVFTAVLFAVGYWQADKMRIGDLHAGAPSLHQDARYNQDTFLISDKYTISSDILKVIVEAYPAACTEHDVMERISRFQWQMENVSGVQSAVSLSSVAQSVNAGFNEGNLKWQSLPRNTASLVQATSRVETSSGLLDGNCSVMPVIIFLNDHKAETIDHVVAKVKEFAAAEGTDKLKFKLASGPVGVMAATNESVSAAQLPMMLYVYGAVILLCLISFRSVKATVAVVLPLYIVSTLAQALMVQLEIGLTVSTLPVIALGVGIGVDYGIYILSSMMGQLKQGVALEVAYRNALVERGSAVLFTGITLAIGVSTWIFSDLKFQVDMGILLTFMFLVNMLGAVLLLPAIGSFLWTDQKK
ncbi:MULTISPECIES: MMPL family transporter [unclassified Pseudoalteromonas]|uniref:efflux RND transporter permease subunit n=1 Tax=Pseudoalteromonas TaxID=53246 RepID=UPI000C9191C5|nr:MULTISPECIES: MMPL family transporter [unclassified Pseudoalteromonas]QLE09483.1 MMPL family transporter [Pseudoalteromonas shioyasakiensis]MAD02525.1 RND transporter [Pseudoalteromonas sp.]NIZ04541.1 MMPL family transporter [Pseudoalteromonas sp. HF66]QWV06006.1 MMPL family transporter [Pseudoalteromonas shioyasakiensis]RZD22699.1 RND family transporter [Pseudoalteromonas sp. MEBiC 03485]|tara:strand:- start:259 stop:2583 length:2325 start_codon:yes stop_codon:yes gene_type:complete